MGHLNQFDRELLSAYIDGALESTERSRAEELLATEASAAHYLQQLRATRQCLQSVPSSPLRSSLTARVLEQARRQALAEGLPSDHHVLRAASNLDGLGSIAELAIGSTSDSASVAGTGGDLDPSTREQQSTLRFTRAQSVAWAALAVAAAVIAGLAVLPFLPERLAGNRVAERGPQETVQPHDGTSPTERSPFDSIASNGTSSATSAGEHTTEPDQSKLPRVPDEVAHVMQGEGALDALNNDLAAEIPKLDFLMIIDAVVSPEGWETGRFEQLLDEFGIPIASPIVTDQKFLEVLEETRVVIGSSDASTFDEQPRAALLYVRADGAILDRLYQAMHQDRESFPQVVTDVSIGENAKLHQLLREQAPNRSPSGPSARVLSASGSATSSEEVVPQFVPAQRRSKQQGSNLPAPTAADLSALGLPGSTPMFEALIILRAPSSN